MTSLLLEGAEAISVTLVGANGSRQVIACADDVLGMHLGDAPGLWGTAPHSFTSSRVANIPGQRLDDVHPEPRLIGLPIVIIASDPLDLQDRLRQLGAVLSPEAEVDILVERADGSIRAISAHVVDGATGLQVADHETTTHRLGLVLRAYDPWWRSASADGAEVVEQFNNGLGAGENPVDIVCGSDIPETWPEIFITGVAENIMVYSHEYGYGFRVIEELGVTDEVRIVTDPARRGVWLNGDRNWRVLDPLAMDFWPLRPGLNRIIMRAIDNAGGANIGSARIRWTPRHQTC